jgi:hypothetical protein
MRLPPALAIVALLGLAPSAATAKGPPIEGHVSFESVRVPLPPGRWEEVDSITIPNPRFPDFPMRQQILVSRSGKVIDRVVRIWVQRKKQLANYFTPYGACEDEGYFHSVVNDNNGDALDCWHVRPMSLGLKGGAEPGNERLAKYGKENGLFVPVVMLGARFVKKPRNELRYYVEYLWTPDLLLPANTPAKVWTPADWTIETVKTDPAKQAVIQPIIDWAADWHGLLK